MDDIRKLGKNEFPHLLGEIGDPPKELYIRGTLPDASNLKWLCVVGSRKYTQYGKDVCEKLIHGFSGYPVVIVSGLALGIDGIAHKAALEAGLKTVSVPGSGLGWDVLYPRTHRGLAENIVKSDGALLSEFAEDFKATAWSFPQRNRLMAGMCHATLIIEATEKSGTLITARLAVEYNRDVLVIPGPVTNASAKGSNQLLRDGAQIVTSSEDILQSLGIEVEDKKIETKHLSEREQKVVSLLREPVSRDELIRALGVPTHEANILLSAMELKGLIQERLGKISLR